MLANSKDFCGSQNFGNSIRGLFWHIAKVDERAVSSIAQKLEISEILATIMYNRGIFTYEDAQSYIDPKLRLHLPNPFDLLDMDKASERIAKAIINGEKIAVFGDYDVDGATSSALLKRFFQDVSIDAQVYIPNRMLEGYGPNKQAFKKLKDDGNTLVITVDCGTVSFEPIAYAKEIGFDVVIIDHHLSLEELPNALAIINPNRVDEEFPHKSMAAVGVAFLTCIAIRSKLRDANFFIDKKEPDLMYYLDLVALGTVCDVVNLNGINRAFVSQGLKLINKRTNIGIAILCDTANLESAIQSYHLGFVIGPRINAGGRVGEGILGSQLLSTHNEGLATEISLKLERLNDERRAMEAVTLEEAINQIEQSQLYLNPVIIVSGNNWHQGILGIIASRIKEKYGKPSAVISFANISGNDQAIGKGSARSIAGIDMGSLLAKGRSMGILLEGGGHAMAGGFAIESNKVMAFEQFLFKNLENTEDIALRTKNLVIDAVLSLSAINGELVKTINCASPFGSGNPQPKFMIGYVTIISARIVGRSHIMFIVADKKTDSNYSDFSNIVKVPTTVKCMFFKAVDTPVGNFLLNAVGKKVCVVGTIQAHHLDASKADFIAEDISIV